MWLTILLTSLGSLGTSLITQIVKNLPWVHETCVWSMGREDPLEKEMATNSSILAWKIPWKRSLVGCSPWGHNESGTTEQVTLMTCDPFSLAFNHVMVSKSNLDSNKELYMLNLIKCGLIYWYNIPVNFLSFINKFLKNTVVYMHYKAKELVLSNCGAGEDSWEFLGLQGN